jgi:UDP-glucose 4-epimerase
MSEKQVVLVTGAGRYWGMRVAARLLAEPDWQVIGLDAEPPRQGIQELDLVQADVRNPLLTELLKAEGVRVVCHLAFVESIERREATFDANVMGTAKLLSACAAAGVRKVVLKSSMEVYGARASNPAFLREEHPLRGSRRYGYTRDLTEIETFCESFRHRVPQLLMTILRFASIVGPTAQTPMTQFLKQRWAPSLWGFDPMMQIIHEDDVVEALAQAVLHDRPGVFNIAAPGAMPLGKIRALAGKAPLSILHPLAYTAAGLLGSTDVPLRRCIPIDPTYLRYPWVGDLVSMRSTFGFQPRHTAEETVREFAQQARLARIPIRRSGELLAEEQLRDIIAERRKAGKGQAHLGSDTGEGWGHDR